MHVTTRRSSAEYGLEVKLIGLFACVQNKSNLCSSTRLVDVGHYFVRVI